MYASSRIQVPDKMADLGFERKCKEHFGNLYWHLHLCNIGLPLNQEKEKTEGEKEIKQYYMIITLNIVFYHSDVIIMLFIPLF